MRFDLYRSGHSGMAENCFYPIKATVTNASELEEAVAYDHVCAEYKCNYRTNNNFLSSNVVVMDLDNDHSENPDDWITKEKLQDIMPDVSFALVTSRNHMAAKGNSTPRPKYHVYFPIGEQTSKDAYAALKRGIQRRWPFFDDNALDAARFVFGSENRNVFWHDGRINIDKETLSEQETGDEWDRNALRGPIPVGSRNSTMSHFAGRLIKRLGCTEEAHKRFLREAQRCIPPLSDEELGHIWSSAVKFGKKVSAEEGYIPPEEYNRIFNLKPGDYTDIGQAKVLVQEYSDALVYTDATDMMRYDGIRWVESKEMAVGACEEFLDLQLAVAEQDLKQAADALTDCGIDQSLISAGGKVLEKAITENSIQAYRDYMAALTFYKFVLKRRDMKFITSTLQAAKPMLLRDIKEFDSDPFLLNTPDATYDLRLGINGAREHRPEDHITKVTLVSPGTDGAKLWRDAVDEFFCGDTDLIEYVQQIAGLAAIGKVFVESLVIAYGGGSNGKSTFWNTISRVMGNYSGTLSSDALTAGCKRNVKPEMAELKGKRLIISSELEEGVRLSTSTIKQLCATDEVGGEKKYKDPFKFVPSHTIVLYTNHLPRVGARDRGTWRRLIVIPFNATIEGKKDIKNYTDYLVEHAGGAVLAWIIEGAQKAIAADFTLTQPQCVQDAVAQYQGNNDWLAHFLDECCEVDRSYTQKSGELYQEYRNFCARTNDYVRSTTDFYTALEAAGFTRRRTNSARIIQGLRLKSEFMD